jgi:hypothetical protein
MATIVNTQGQLVDLTTGEVVGRTEAAPTTTTDPRKGGEGAPAQVTQGGDKVLGLVNNLSWGFNAGMFALPDAAQRVIGKGLGLDENQVFQFARFFNRGQVAPRNSEERYARAIGEGVGNTLPFTGILAYSAAARPLISTTVVPRTVTEAGKTRNVAPVADFFRGISDDSIRLIQRSPRAAAALDVAFGAGWETLRQAVEENVSDDNPSKGLYKEMLPAAAFIGLPMAAFGLMKVSPTARAFNWAKDKSTGAGVAMSDVEQEAMAGVPGPFKLPLVNIIPKVLIKNAERKLGQVFGPISESKEAQEALTALERAMADPRFAEAGFVFDAAEKTMYSPLVREKFNLLEQLGPKELESIKLRINQNQENLNKLFGELSPQARQPVLEAFQAAQADRQAFFEGLLRQRADLTNAEVAALSERLGPQNIDMLNNELRGVLMSRMELDNRMRQNVLSRMGLKQATAPDGTPLPTRQDGKSLFQAQDMEGAVMELLKKYRPERPSMRVSLPEPIRLLNNFVQSQQLRRQKLENQALDSLIDDVLRERLGAPGEVIGEDLYKITFDNIKSLFSTKGMSKKQMAEAAREAQLLKGANFKVDEKGMIRVSTGIPGRALLINPQQMRDDAARIARESTKIDINVPEALDYLTAAQRFRNDSLSNYNAAMSRGRTRQTDAQRIMDTGNAVFKDIEGLVLNHSPRLKGEYDAMKMVLDDYKSVYDKTVPLLLTQTKKGGQEFLLPNEDLLRNAFRTADGVKDVSAILGNDPQSQALMMKGTIDWLRTKGVVNKDGLVDPKMIRSVLDKNKNIVEALPEPVRAKLADEVKLADDFVNRVAEIDQRMVAAKDNELDRLLAKAVRPGGDPRIIFIDALRDSAVMTKLVGAVGRDPEMLAALRRSVYDVATEGVQGGGSLKSFLDNNERSLKVLFSGTTHLQDLNMLADLQRRVNAFANVTGQIPAFESLDEGLKRVFGSGIQYLTTTMREAAVGRISPETGALALMVRLTGSLENQLYKRIFTRALESEEFAKNITRVGTPEQAAKAAKSLEEIGISAARVLQPARMGAQQAISGAAQGEQPEKIAGMENLPVVPTPAPRTTAREMLNRVAPAAPPTRGFNPRLPTTPQAPRGGGAGQVPLMYPAMFPNDPISALLQQRAAALGGQPPQQ